MKAHSKPSPDWLCGVCGNMYDTEERAEKCCTCYNCGKPLNKRIREKFHVHCDKCQLEFELIELPKTIKSLQKELDGYKKRLAKFQLKKKSKG